VSSQTHQTAYSIYAVGREVRGMEKMEGRREEMKWRKGRKQH